MKKNGIKRFPNGSIGVTQGSRVMFSDFADGGAMWTGAGDRETRHLVTFAEAYREPPSVHVSISMWDTDHQTNARGDLTADQITTTGFHLVFRTWGDTRVARIRADWMAVGAVPDEDDWDIG